MPYVPEELTCLCQMKRGTHHCGLPWQVIWRTSLPLWWVTDNRASAHRWGYVVPKMDLVPAIGARCQPSNRPGQGQTVKSYINKSKIIGLETWVKSTCSHRGPRFHFSTHMVVLNPNSSSENLMPLSDISRHQACMWYTDICAGKTCIRIKIK